jgi:hypothetical protein
MAKKISKASFDLCLRHEVTSKAYYEKHYQRPEWPGLQSGVTVGIGYDLGQASRSKIIADWQGLVDSNMLVVMACCSGYTGNAGKAKLAEVRSKILIPWSAAIKVFAERDVPTWTAEVLRKVPGADQLTPSMLGVLFDTAYNRGHSWSMAGERYAEMRAIKSHVASGNLSLVPGEFYKMKRLWPNTKGLLRRCDDRAALWLWALSHKNEDSQMADLDIVGPSSIGTPNGPVALPPTPAAPDPTVPMNAGAARTKPATSSTAQNTAAATIAAGGAAAAAQAHASGLAGGATAIGIAIAAALVAVAVWFVWFRHRNPK